MADHPEFLIPQHGMVWSEDKGTYMDPAPKRVDEFEWYSAFSDLTKSRHDIEKEMRVTLGRDYWEYRYIGIEIGCYDDQNMNLPYPIKLVEHPVPYPAAAASNSDPDQGWGTEDRFEKLPSLNNQISFAQQKRGEQEQEMASSEWNR